MVYFLAIGLMEIQLHARKTFNIKLEKCEKWDETLQMSNFIYDLQEKNTINVIAAHVLTHWSENIYILCHCPYSLVPPNVRTFPSTFSPIRTFYTIALHEQVALFHALKLYSTDQFSFCLIRPDSIMCHFLVNNLRNRFRSLWSLYGLGTQSVPSQPSEPK